MLCVCDQMVTLQAALGNGKLHGINGRHIFGRRPWAAGHLTAFLNKDFAVSSMNRGSVDKPRGDVCFKRRHAWGEMVLLSEVWLSLGHEELQNSKTSVRGNAGANSKSGFIFWQNVLFPPQAVLQLSREHSHPIFFIISQNEIIVRPGDMLVSCSVGQSLPDQHQIRQL